jgi:ADP-heptose:LPS heptosyltransferase
MASPRLEEFRRHLTPRLTRGVLGATHATEQTTLPRTGIHRILICRTVHTLGDSLMLTPLLDELANIYPGAEMDIISGYPSAAALYAVHPNVRCVFCLPAHVPGHPLGTLRALRSMRQKHYDLAIDPDPRSQSGRLLTLYASAARKLGYLGPNKGGALSHGVDVSGAPSHRAMEGVYLLRTALGEDAMLRKYPQPSLWLSVEERERGRQRLAHVSGVRNAAEPLPRIGIFANATRNKLLSLDWWRRFLAAFKPHTSQYCMIEILPAFGRSLLEDRYPNFDCSDVRRLAAMLANLSLYISADCGVMHLAWATGAPTIGLFNATKPAEWGPWGGHNRSLDLHDTTPEQIALSAAKVLDAVCNEHFPYILAGPISRDNVTAR